MHTNPLGTYLRDRRARLDPIALGFVRGRRRTPGLRREEVAQRAGISPTWYTWLEQGRGGAPSSEVLERLAVSLLLTEPEREHLFLLALGHLPEARYAPAEGVSPRLQRVLDAFTVSPAVVRTATWDVVAWNRAAAAVLVDYGALPREQRNVLRLLFVNPTVRARQTAWPEVARLVVDRFRAEATRAGASAELAALVAELSEASAEFAALWRNQGVVSPGEGVKHMRHPQIGALALEYSTFAVDGRPDLALVVYNPATDEVAQRIADHLAGPRTSHHGTGAWRS